MSEQLTIVEAAHKDLLSQFEKERAAVEKKLEQTSNNLVTLLHNWVKAVEIGKLLALDENGFQQHYYEATDATLASAKKLVGTLQRTLSGTSHPSKKIDKLFGVFNLTK